MCRGAPTQGMETAQGGDRLNGQIPLTRIRHVTQEEQRLRWRVYRAVRYALKTGRLVRPQVCTVCARPPRPAKDGRCTLQSHHADYTRPLDVEWRCLDCHSTITPRPRGSQNGAYTRPDRVRRGEAHGRAKVTADQVREMRRLFDAGSVGVMELGRRYGLNHKTVGQLVRRQIWRCVNG